MIPGIHHGDWRLVMQTLPHESVDLLLTASAPVDDLDAVLACASTKLKPNSHVYVFGTWQTYTDVAPVVERHFDLRNTLAWGKDTGATAGGHDNYGEQDELILFAHKGRRHLNGRRAGDVVRFERAGELLQYLIGKSAQESEIVLDPFMATGDTMLAAKTVRRGFIGIERDRERYDQAALRLA